MRKKEQHEKAAWEKNSKGIETMWWEGGKKGLGRARYGKKNEQADGSHWGRNNVYRYPRSSRFSLLIRYFSPKVSTWHVSNTVQVWLLSSGRFPFRKVTFHAAPLRPRSGCRTYEWPTLRHQGITPDKHQWPFPPPCHFAFLPLYFLCKCVKERKKKKKKPIEHDSVINRI